jgi:ammonia channel protein AmtB
MIRRVTRIAPWQAGKFFAVLYFIFGLVFAIPFMLFVSAAPAEQAGFGIGFVLAFPFIYALGALIFVPLACLIFNFVAKLVGGLDFEVVERDVNPA